MKGPHKLIIWSLFLLLLYSCNNHSDQFADTVSLQFETKMKAINSFIDQNEYDNAKTLLLELIPTIETEHEKALYRCTQAEIMFHNNLINFGFDNIKKAEKYNENLQNRLLTSHIKSLKGVYLIHINKPDSAIYFLKEAIALTDPKYNNINYAQYYKLAHNIAFAYLKLNKSDSAGYYAHISNQHIPKNENKHYYALNYYIIAEALLQDGNIQHAKKYYNNALQYANNRPNITHDLLSGLIKIAEKENNRNDFNKWVELGLLDANLKNVSIKTLQVFFRILHNNHTLFPTSKSYLDAEGKIERYFSIAVDEESKHQTEVLMRYYDELENTFQLSANEKKRELLLHRIRLLVMFFVIIMMTIFSIVLYSRSQLKQKLLLNTIENQAHIRHLEQERILTKRKAIENERSRISKELHDDIGSSVSSLKIYQNLALKEFKSRPEKVEELIDKSIKEIKIIEENLEDLIWAVYTQKQTFENLILRMKQYAFDTLSAKDIQSEFQYPSSLNEIQIPIGYRKNLLLIFKEFVNNSAKYSTATNFKLMIELDEENAIIELWDNGIGFDSINTQLGKGLSNMKYRALAMHAAFDLKSSSGKGTLLRMEIPLKPQIKVQAI